MIETECDIEAIKKAIIEEPSTFPNIPRSCWDNKAALSIRGPGNVTIAHMLAIQEPDWHTNDKEIFSLRAKNGMPVAWLYIQNRPQWIPDDKDILSLTWDTSDMLLFGRKDSGSIAYVVAENNPSWVTYDKDVLMLKGSWGDNTVAHFLAENRTHWQPQDNDILKMEGNGGLTVAHILVEKSLNWSTSEPEILKLSTGAGLLPTVAHLLARYRPEWHSQDKAILMLQNNNGWSVAHELASNRTKWITYDKDVLQLEDRIGRNVSEIILRSKPDADVRVCKYSKVKHFLSRLDELNSKIPIPEGSSGYHSYKASNVDKVYNYEKLSKECLSDIHALQLEDEKGWPLAHILANYHYSWVTEEPKILNLFMDHGGMSVAHILAYQSSNKGWQTNNPDILMLRNKLNGTTVAHMLAAFSSTWTTAESAILALKDNNGIDVATILNRR